MEGHNRGFFHHYMLGAQCMTIYLNVFFFKQNDPNAILILGIWFSRVKVESIDD